MSDIVGFVLSLERCPYLFATDGVATLPTSSDDDWSSAWTLLRGALDWRQPPAWQVRARSDGSMETTSLAFTINDVLAASGEAAGQNVATWLFTRRRQLIASTRLTVALDTASPATITVDSVAALGISGYPAVVYVDREAIKVSGSGSATTLTVANRGWYGSTAVAHPVDGDNLVNPTVFAAFPGAVRLRAILWSVDEAGAATPEWRGTVGSGPELAEPGAALSLPCEGIWTSVAAQRVGNTSAVTRLVGYYGEHLFVAVYRDGTGLGGGSGGGPVHKRTLLEACDAMRARLDRAIRDGGVTDVTVQCAPYGSGVRAFAASASGTTVEVTLRVGSQRASSTGSGTGSPAGRTAAVVLDRVPTAVVRSPRGPFAYLAVDTLEGLPASFAATTYTDGGLTTVVKPSLRGEYGSDFWVVLDVGSTGTSPVTEAGGAVRADPPWVYGGLQLVPRGGVPAAPAAPDAPAEVVVEGATALRTILLVRTQHFAAGLKHLLDQATPNLGSLVNASDWDWDTTFAAVVAATSGVYAAREWEIDGSQQVGELVKQECSANGLALTLVASRLALVPIGPATASATAAAAIDEDDLVADPTWQALAEEQITSLDVASEALTIRLRNAGSESLYGPGRTREIKLEGQRETVRALNSYRDFAEYVFGRIAGTFAEPIASVTIVVPWSTFGHSVYVGSYVDLSTWLAPDGAGGRNIGGATALAAFAEATARAQVVGADPDLAANTLTVTALLFSQVYGYAPACKVKESPSTTTVVAAVDYIEAQGTYDDPDSSSADGGASQFRTDDFVVFRRMDSTTETVYGPYEVASVSSATVTFKTTLDAALRTAIAGGDWYDLCYAPLSDIDGGGDALRQASFAFCGDDATGIIGGMSQYPNRPWAP